MVFGGCDARLDARERWKLVAALRFRLVCAVFYLMRASKTGVSGGGCLALDRAQFNSIVVMRDFFILWCARWMAGGCFALDHTRDSFCVHLMCLIEGASDFIWCAQCEMGVGGCLAL
jgi:hypothetical protein